MLKNKLRFSFLVILLIVLTAGCGRGAGGDGSFLSPGAGSLGGVGGADGLGGQSQPSAVNPLTGLPIEASQLDWPFALVAIGNNPGARPQAGLRAADLVYEVPAEGGITRLLGLFRGGQAPVIGPVRSSRTYILDLAREWNGVLVHVGGSPGHYAAVGASGVQVFDDAGASGQGIFWRSKDRRPPNNLYTSSERLRQRLAAKGGARLAGGQQQSGDGWRPFRFQEPGNLPTGEPAAAVSIPWPGQTGAPVVFRYDDAAGHYQRFIGGTPHNDATDGQPLAAASVLVQFTPVRSIAGDSEGRLAVDLVGSGRLLIFSRGQVRQGSWHKSQISAPTQFMNTAGEPVQLPPGQVWILIVPNTVSVDIDEFNASDGS